MDEKTILITGSSRGLGAHAAFRFAQKGHAVVINHSESPDEASALLSRIKKDVPGSKAIACQADVADRRQVQDMFDQIYARFNRCDVLINMAGVNMDEPFLGMKDDSWNRVIQTVLTGTFICCQEYARRYRGDAGHIINIGAVTAIKGRKNGANYCSARAGVLNLTRCLALELAPAIMVNTVTPGYIATEEVVARHSLHIKENHERAVSSVPAGRLGCPEDVFKMLEFLVDGAPYVTGQNFMVDSGFLMR